MYQNRTTLIGFLGKDAEKRTTKNEVPYTVLSLATKDSWKDREGVWQSRTEWHRCIVWGAKFADFAAGLKKGAHLQVEGELLSREYQKDGVAHHVFEIRTKSILKLDRAQQQTEAVPQEAELSDVPF
ncbi:MAG: single-stranded DNA-binding protein [Acidobacteria bacterium]|nr:single-stranded DNA-binding protein [Acidobacteriota bacterium]